MSPDRGQSEAHQDEVLATGLEKLSVDSTAPAIEEETPPHLSHDKTNNAKRTDPFQFGQRYLKDEDDVFEFNAWDHVVPDAEYEAYCESQYAKQRAAPVSDFDKNRILSQPEKWWDLFYKQKSNTFFKDRKWLAQEFPILKDITRREAGKKVLLEVGAGAGNTAFPIMRMNWNPDLEVVAADFSKTAVETMRNADDIQAKIGRVRAEVWDAAGEALPEGLEESSCDVVVMIFIFSALNPTQWAQAAENVSRLLKPGGVLLFRDYSKGDLSAVRYKANRFLEKDYYCRGDGTTTYYFDKGELEKIWGERLVVRDLDVDHRLIVNRKRRIKMFRAWIQGRWQKPSLNIE